MADQITVTTAQVNKLLSALEELNGTIGSDASVKTLTGYANKDTVLRAGYHDGALEAVGTLEDDFGTFANKLVTTVDSINGDILQLKNNLAAVKQQFDITDDNATWTAAQVETLFQGVGSGSSGA